MNTDKNTRVYPHTQNRFKEFSRALSHKLLHFFFPKTCIVCGKGSELVCSSCLAARIEYFEEKNIVSVFRYKNPVIRKVIWALKFHKDRTIGRDVLGTFLYEAILDKFSEQAVFSGQIKNTPTVTLVPIPLSKERKRARGYNQSLDLAEGIIKEDGAGVFLLDETVLKKIKNTAPQTEMKNKKTRLTNLNGAFQLDGQKSVKGKTIVLIDDVTTTGATFHEATRTLKEAGAKDVWCFAVAH